METAHLRMLLPFGRAIQAAGLVNGKSVPAADFPSFPESPSGPLLNQGELRPENLLQRSHKRPGLFGDFL